MTPAEMLYDVLSQMTPEQLKHQNPNVRKWYDAYKPQDGAVRIKGAYEIYPPLVKRAPA